MYNSTTGRVHPGQRGAANATTVSGGSYTQPPNAQVSGGGNLPHMVVGGASTGNVNNHSMPPGMGGNNASVMSYDPNASSAINNGYNNRANPMTSIPSHVPNYSLSVHPHPHPHHQGSGNASATSAGSAAPPGLQAQNVGNNSIPHHTPSHHQHSHHAPMAHLHPQQQHQNAMYSTTYHNTSPPHSASYAPPHVSSNPLNTDNTGAYSLNNTMGSVGGGHLGGASAATTSSNSLWMFLESYVMTERVSELCGAVLAIDARYFLRRMESMMPLLFSFHARATKVYDPMGQMYGGVAGTLRSALIQELSLLNRIPNLRVMFIFDGMQPAEPTAGETDLRSSTATAQDEAWRSVGNGGFTPHGVPWSTTLFENVPGPRLQSEETIIEIMHILYEERANFPRMDFIRAPSTAGAQIQYFMSKGIVSAVYAPPSIFWIGGEGATMVPPSSVKLCIVDISAEPQTGSVENFRYISYDDFTSITELPSMTYPPPHKMRMVDKLFALAPVMDENGYLLMSDGTVPFLDEMTYVYHALGILSPTLLTAAARHTMVENPPAVDSRELRTVLERIIPLRTQLTCKLIPRPTPPSASPNSRLFSLAAPSQLKWYRWFKTSPTDVARPPPIELDEWDLSLNAPITLDDTTVMQVAEQYHLNARKRGMVPLHPYGAPLPDVVATVNLKFLDLLGYFTHSTVEGEVGGPPLERSGKSTFSECLALAAIHYPSIDFGESAILLIELIRTKSLSTQRFTEPSDSSLLTSLPFQGKEEGRNRAAILLARLVSLVPVTHSTEMPFVSHVSKDLVAFWSVLRTFRSALRHLGESIAVTSVLPSMPTEDLMIRARLPFSRVHYPVLGAVLEYIIALGPDFHVVGDSMMSPAQKLSLLQREFPSIRHLEEALNHAFTWLDVAYAIAERLAVSDSDEPMHARQNYTNAQTTIWEARELIKQIQAQLFGMGTSPIIPPPAPSAPPSSVSEIGGITSDVIPVHSLAASSTHAPSHTDGNYSSCPNVAAPSTSNPSSQHIAHPSIPVPNHSSMQGMYHHTPFTPMHPPSPQVQLQQGHHHHHPHHHHPHSHPNQTHQHHPHPHPHTHHSHQYSHPYSNNYGMMNYPGMGQMNYSGSRGAADTTILASTPPSSSAHSAGTSNASAPSSSSRTEGPANSNANGSVSSGTRGGRAGRSRGGH